MRIDDNAPTKAEFISLVDSGIAEVGLSRATYAAVSNMSRFGALLTREPSSTTIVSARMSRTNAAVKPVLASCPIEAAESILPKPYDSTKPLFEPLEDASSKGSPTKSEEITAPERAGDKRDGSADPKADLGPGK
jgi:hypothetical protein